MAITTIRQMKAHQKGIITKIKGGGLINRRLRDMGLVAGSVIEIAGRAPLYDPVNIKVRGNNLTLRNSEADYIEVDAEDLPESETQRG